VSEYDVPGLSGAAPAFVRAVHRGEQAAQAIRQLRTRQHSTEARLPVDLSGLDGRLRSWAEEVGRSAELLIRTATEVGDADRRAALEISAARGAVPHAGKPDRPAGLGLHRGDTGPAVRALQRRLAAAGLDPGPVDGRFGSRTAAALRAYQRAHHLDVTGRTDLETATALLNQPVRVLPATPHGPNGRLPASELTGVGDGRQMYMPAAQAFRRMDATATAAGHDLHVNSGYRTYGEQAALYQAYRNGTGNLAAAPGHSTHGLGLSADIQVTDPATLRWLRAHAGTYVRQRRAERGVALDLAPLTRVPDPGQGPLGHTPLATPSTLADTTAPLRRARTRMGVCGSIPAAMARRSRPASSSRVMPSDDSLVAVTVRCVVTSSPWRAVGADMVLLGCKEPPGSHGQLSGMETSRSRRASAADRETSVPGWEHFDRLVRR
jgi:peptidoglycan hydrolase-like protein with peptidoglycan-binding domain